MSRIGFGAMQLPGPGVWGPPADRDAAPAVLRRAVELGVDQVVLAWLLQHDPRVLLIPGTSSVAHLEENVAAGALALTEDDIHALDALQSQSPA